MRAALYDRYGTAGDVLRVEEIERPEPGPGEVRVRIEVSGINPVSYTHLDVYKRQLEHLDVADRFAVEPGCPCDRGDRKSVV